MRWLVLLAVALTLAGCTSPWIHKERGRVQRSDPELRADWEECGHVNDCMEAKGWYRGKGRVSRTGRGSTVWFNQDVAPEQMERQYRMDQSKCRTVALTAPMPVGGGLGRALLFSKIQSDEIMKTCMEGLGWERKFVSSEPRKVEPVEPMAYESPLPEHLKSY